MSAPLRIYPHENQAADLGPGKKELRSGPMSSKNTRIAW